MIQSLYEDGEILVLDKPAGLAAQPGEGVRISLVDAVERDFGFRPFLVHRLDKETSGLIIVARDSRSAAKWTAAIGSREVGKYYRAVCAAGPASILADGGASGRADAATGSSGSFTEPIKMRGGAFSAETRWRLLCRFGGVGAQVAGKEGGFSYFELELGTGRTHQIRLHLAGAGMPILGDDRHGDFALNRAVKKAFGLKRLLLHARRLVLPDGTVVTAPTPGHFLAFFAAFPDAPDPEAP